MRADIVPGAKFPDYELTDTDKKRHKLSELQGIDPMILMLSRGHFCPKDHQQHLELAAFYPQDRGRLHEDRDHQHRQHPRGPRVQGRGGRAMAVPLRSRPQGAEGPRDPGIHRPHHDPMIPHTLVLDPGLVIHKIYNGYWFWGRPSPEDLRQDLREVTRKVRPDWDLGAIRTLTR